MGTGIADEDWFGMDDDEWTVSVEGLGRSVGMSGGKEDASDWEFSFVEGGMDGMGVPSAVYPEEDDELVDIYESRVFFCIK